MEYVEYDILSRAFKYVGLGLKRSCTLMSCLMATTTPEIVRRSQSQASSV